MIIEFTGKHIVYNFETTFEISDSFAGGFKKYTREELIKIKTELESIYEHHVKSSLFVALASFAFGGILAVYGLLGKIIGSINKSFFNLIPITIISIITILFSMLYLIKSKRDMKIQYFRDQIIAYLERTQKKN